MSKCAEQRIDFRRLDRRVVEADFSGGELCSDGWLTLLRQVDRQAATAITTTAILGQCDIARPAPQYRSYKRSVVGSLRRRWSDTRTWRPTIWLPRPSASPKMIRN